MKKLFIFLFIVLLTFKVEAKTYYSDYGEYKLSDKNDINDLTKVKIEKRYLIFKEERVEAFYPSYMTIDNMIKTDETKVVSSEWLDEKPENLKDRKIKTKDIYEYQNMKKIRYITFKSFSANFSLSEIKVYDQNKEIDYDFKYNDNIVSITKDNNYETFAYFNSDDNIVVDLKKEISIEDLRLEFSVYTCNNIMANFNVSLLGSDNNQIYALKNIEEELNIKSGFNFFYEIVENSFEPVNPMFEEKEVSEIPVEATKFKKVVKKTKYQYEDLWIKYYKLEKNYLDDYYLEPLEGYQIDLEKSKEFYYTSTRDKVTIKDRLIIDNYNSKLEDLIIDSTVPDIKITSNINYYKNGSYDINFITPFKTIKETVIVDIKENYIKLLKNQNKYLKDLEIENNRLFIENNKLNVTLKEVLKNKDDELNKAYDKLVKYKYENEELKKAKIDINEENMNKFNFKIIIYIIPLLILFLLLFLRKKSIQNNN